MEKALFKEVQYFPSIIRWSVTILSAGTILLMIYGGYQQLFLGESFGTNGLSNRGLVIVMFLNTLISLGVLWLFLRARLLVEIDGEELRYRFAPFHRKIHTLNWNDVSEAKIRNYKAFKEFGGWGIRYNRKGKAFTASGKMGLDLKLKNGKQVLFSTHRAEEVKSLLAQTIPVGMA